MEICVGLTGVCVVWVSVNPAVLCSTTHRGVVEGSYGNLLLPQGGKPCAVLGLGMPLSARVPPHAGSTGLPHARSFFSTLSIALQAYP
eukprot:355907-Chlamydomonas_euryale.AAC.4